jgi:chromosome segregation ATPase
MRRSRQELSEINTELAGLREEMKAAVALLEKHQSRLAADERRIEVLDRTVWEMLNGRIWRSLELIGRVPRKLFKRT